jgi:PPK2 family polyphosphate:nucleotide phosphotransferase
MHKPSPIVLLETPPCLSDVHFDKAIVASKSVYEKRLKKLQKQMLQIQQAYYHQGRRAIIVFEGWDAAGKGGAIRRLTEKLDPRGFTVNPISAPTAEEQGRHYLYRFQSRLPAPGGITIFDRSYYGRVLVERVEGFASEHQWQRAYQEINEFERLLMDDGVCIVKLFIHINKDEQIKRFDERLNNPVKRWKLTEEDIRNHMRWSDYEQAIDQMFTLTATQNAPWNVIPGKMKWFARLAVLEVVTHALAKGVDISVPPINPDVVAAAEALLGIKRRE